MYISGESSKTIFVKENNHFFQQEESGKVYKRQENTSYKLLRLLLQERKSRTIDFLRRPQKFDE
jgi:hypothetical protein